MLRNIAAVLLLLYSTALLADTLALRADHPDRYVVVKGDTLWDISARFLTDPWLWRDVWHINPAIENPHLIYPGDLIRLVYIDGKPTLQLDRGKKTIKLSPQIRATALESPIPTVSLEQIQQFLTRPRVISQQELDQSGYIVAGDDGRLISGAGLSVYARNIQNIGSSYFNIYHVGKAYQNPNSKKGEILGFEAIQVGDARITQTGDPAKLLVTHSYREILLGDRLLPPLDQTLNQNFIPRAPDKSIEGMIISVLDGIAKIGRYQTIVINQGLQDGVEVGHVLTVHQQGRTIRDHYAKKPGEKVTLPDEAAGTVMIFRAFEHVSYALVMDAKREIKLYDSVKTP
ncbi:MAG: LysM peptidoglycan-binding domain-containing protein [Gammaproteobacteria bacterium]|nr:LysM peptidoglycan-binding domain-containing protein [Gammaproteobacteria bacterium]